MGNTTPTAISLAPPLLPLPHPCITRERVKRVKRAAQSEFHFARLHLVLAKAGLPAVESRRSTPIPQLILTATGMLYQSPKSVNRLGHCDTAARGAARESRSGPRSTTAENRSTSSRKSCWRQCDRQEPTPCASQECNGLAGTQ